MDLLILIFLFNIGYYFYILFIFYLSIKEDKIFIKFNLSGCFNERKLFKKISKRHCIALYVGFNFLYNWKLKKNSN